MNRLQPDKGDRPKMSTRKRSQRKTNVIYVTRLLGGEREQFIFYGHWPQCYMTHYTSAGTKLCWEDHSLCEGGHLETNLRENWVIHGYSMTKGRETFVYLTPSAIQQLEDQTEPGASLRGKICTLTRTASKKGRLYVDVSTELSRDPKTLPPIRDHYESVLNFTKTTEVPKGTSRLAPGPSNPSPERNGHLIT